MTKNIFITGGTSGIGKALVYKFADKKWDIFFTYKNNLQEAKKISIKLKANNVKHQYAKMDLNKKNSIKNAFNKFSFKFKTLNYLINSASIESKREVFIKISDDEIKKNINSFLIGNLILLKNALKLILKNKIKKENGILNISSYSSITGGRNIHLYAASKAAINILLSALSADYKKHQITIQSVLPRFIDTDTFRKSNKILNEKDLKKFMKKKKILGIKKPEQFAKFVHKIITNKNRYKNRNLIFYDKK